MIKNPRSKVGPACGWRWAWSLAPCNSSIHKKDRGLAETQVHIFWEGNEYIYRYYVVAWINVTRALFPSSPIFPILIISVEVGVYHDTVEQYLEYRELGFLSTEFWVGKKKKKKSHKICSVALTIIYIFLLFILSCNLSSQGEHSFYKLWTDLGATPKGLAHALNEQPMKSCWFCLSQ